MYQKNANNLGMPNRLRHKIMLIMRFTTVILLASLMQVSAAGLAQKITLSKSNSALKAVLKDLKQQSGFIFLYTDNILKLAKPVDIKVTDKDFLTVLDEIFSHQPLTYEINKNTITIKEKSPRLQDSENRNIDTVDIRGTVLDEKGNPLPGATVKLKGISKSALTNENGRFSLSGVDPGQVLLISYIGYETEEVSITAGQINGEGGITIRLKLKTGNLEEVAIVNTGYQKISRLYSTGSTITIGSAELEKRNAVNIMDNLEGTVPGLVQYRDNATIRGVSTFQANKKILVVVDGFPIEGSVADINPYDVESVSVLKDAAAAAIYGARASNGVIVVTTKRAKEIGKTTVEVSGNVTITDKPDYSYQNFMNPAEHVDWESRYYNWYFNGGGGIGGTIVDPIGTFETSLSLGNAATPVQYAYYRFKKSPSTFSQGQLDALLNEYKTNDFHQQFKDNALLNKVIQQYNFALRTSNGKSQSSLVLNYKTNNSGIINAFDRQFNLFYKGTYNVGSGLDINYGVNGVLGKVRSHNSEYATNPFNVPAYTSLIKPDGSRDSYSTIMFNQYNTLPETTPALSLLKFNHLDELERDFANTSTLNTRYYVDLNFKPLKGLTVNPMFQYEDNRSDVSAYSEPESYTMRYLQDVYTSRTGNPGAYVYTNLLPKGGKLASSEIKSPSYTARAQANYNREFGLHRIIAISGAEFRQTRTHGTKGILLGYDDQLQISSTNTVNFGTLRTYNSAPWNPAYPAQTFDFPDISDIGLILDTRHRYASGYANATYTYDRKYNLFGSIRKDYADLFGSDEKYRGRPLWSVGASWIASNETFLKGVTFLNYLKVRASYGLTGNIDPTTPSILAATTGLNSETRLPNAAVTNPPNPQLRWEKTATSNIGLDFAVLDNRLRGALDLYKRVGTDLFARKRLDPSEGFTSMVINNASMVNKGVEISLSCDWVKSASDRGFNWSSSLLGAWNKNKITYVDEVTTNPSTLASDGGFKVGDPVRSLYSFRFAGLTDTGLPQFYTADGNKATQQVAAIGALIFSGGAEPKMNIAFNNNLTFKGFSLDVYTVYYGGHHFRARQMPEAYSSPRTLALPSYLLDSWTPSNTDTDIPGSGQYFAQSLNGGLYRYADILIRSADFIKIRNVALGFQLPRDIASKMKAGNLSLRFQLNNPQSIWTRQKDVHVDPETGLAPIPTSYVLGINANF